MGWLTQKLSNTVDQPVPSIIALTNDGRLVNVDDTETSGATQSSPSLKAMWIDLPLVPYVEWTMDDLGAQPDDASGTMVYVAIETFDEHDDLERCKAGCDAILATRSAARVAATEDNLEEHKNQNVLPKVFFIAWSIAGIATAASVFYYIASAARAGQLW